jgi:hypothetical protein
VSSWFSLLKVLQDVETVNDVENCLPENGVEPELKLGKILRFRAHLRFRSCLLAQGLPCQKGSVVGKTLEKLPVEDSPSLMMEGQQ